jgi:hypothetical protein
MRNGAGAWGLRLGMAVAVALLVTGCQLLRPPRPSVPPTQSAEWGPLAVVEGDFGFDAGLGSGRLTIRPRCVTIRGDGSATTLVWPSQRTRWDGASRTIEYDDRDLGPLELRDGMTVRLGGGDPDVLPDLEWLVPLAPPCPDATFLVTQVVIVDEP